MSVPLIEKYRPETLDEVVSLGSKVLLDKIISRPADMPSLLLYGPQGTGKTTVIKALTKALAPIDIIRINGSDTTGVDTIRDRVLSFISAMGSVKNKPKIVWIEEFDFMSASAFAALRSMMEQYVKNARFLCTANFINKIPEPIQSRFLKLEFGRIPTEHILTRLEHIAKLEQIDTTSLPEIAKRARGDLRTAINILQEVADGGEPSGGIADTLPDALFVMITAGSWTKIRKEIPLLNPEYEELLVSLNDKIFESDLDAGIKASCTEVIATGLYEMPMCFDKDICFSAISSRLIKAVRT